MTTIIEFGSRRHGCHDVFSDKDVYLLYGLNDGISQEIADLERLGYSVTSSSTSRAAYLSTAGSLFVRHVFFEGKVIRGSHEDKDSIKKAWRPAHCYEHEIEENIEMLALLENLPSTIESLATTNDIVICSLRNILIRKLANKGIFVFSWVDIISHSVKFNFIGQSDAVLIREARKYKNSYRRGFLPKLSSAYMSDLERLTNKVIDKRRKFKHSSHANILAAPEKASEGSYTQLRAIELLCSHYHFDKQMEKYSALVQNPAYFLTFGRSKASQCARPGIHRSVGSHVRFQGVSPASGA